MNHLKLIIKNPNLATKKVNRFFNKSELRIILNLYSKMVSKGFWKDYGLNISKEEVSFNVYRRASENAEFRICKNFRLKNKNLKYFTSDARGNILNKSKNLEELLNNFLSRGSFEKNLPKIKTIANNIFTTVGFI